MKLEQGKMVEYVLFCLISGKFFDMHGANLLTKILFYTIELEIMMC